MFGAGAKDLSKRAGQMFKTKRYVPPPSAPLRPLERIPNYSGETQPMPKETPWRSEKWLAAVRALEYCVLCGAHGVEPAHRNESKGMGTKTDDSLTAALCRPCHVAIDSGNGLEREERRARIDAAILMTLVQLARKGKVKAV